MHTSLVSDSVPHRPYDGNGKQHSEASAFGLRELFFVLRRNLWLLLLLGAVSGGGTLYLLSREAVRFKADGLIRVRLSESEVIDGLVPGGQTRQTVTSSKADPFLSELMVLQGRQVAGVVVDKEGFRLFDLEFGAPSPLTSDVRVTLPPTSDAELLLRFEPTQVSVVFGRQRVIAPYGRPVVLDGVRFTVPARPQVPQVKLTVIPRESAVDWLRGAINARPVTGTDAILVSATSPSPLLSTLIANSTIEAYQSANTGRSRELNHRRRTFLEARLRETDDSLVTAQTALAHFRSRTGVYGAHEQFQAERSGAHDAERQRKELLAEQRIRRSLLAEVTRSSNPTQSAAFRTLLASESVSGNPMVSQLYGRLIELETKRDTLIASGRPVDHADVRQVQTLMASTEARLLDAIRSQVNSFDTRVAALGDVRKEAEAEVTRLTPTEAEEVRLNEQVEAMRAVGGQLRAELQRTRLAQAADIGQVEIVDRARRALPIGRGRPLKLALGILLGLLVGTAIAVLRNYLNTGLHSRTDVDEVLRVPGLVVIPQLPRGAQPRPFFAARLDAAFGTRAPRDSIRHGAANGRGVIQPELVTISNATNSASGAYRALRTRLLFGPNSGAALRRVVVTSAWSGEGKTTTAANLAVTLAQQGMRVLLVDCDLRQPRLHVLFGLRNPVGLTDVLLGRRTLEDHVVQPSGVERLSLLTSGPTDAGAVGASELLGGQRMTKLLTTVLEHFDVTVLDTPPVLLAPDASILAARADGTLLVLYAGRTGRSLAQDAVQQLVAVGANVVGAVLNDPDGRTAQYQEYVR